MKIVNNHYGNYYNSDVYLGDEKRHFLSISGDIRERDSSIGILLSVDLPKDLRYNAYNGEIDEVRLCELIARIALAMEQRLENGLE